jgi:hypothetical protein
VARSSPRRLKRGCGAMRTTTYRSPSRPPRSPESPSPRSNSAVSSSIPGGMFTVIASRWRTSRSPRHSRHGVRMISPSPRQRSQGATRVTVPRIVVCVKRTRPEPAQSGQRSGVVLGSAPTPLQRGHTRSRSTSTVCVAPCSTSSSVMTKSTRRSAPSMGPRVIVPMPPPKNIWNRFSAMLNGSAAAALGAPACPKRSYTARASGSDST